MYDQFEENEGFIDDFDRVVTMIKKKTDKIDFQNIVEDSFFTNRTGLLAINYHVDNKSLIAKKQYNKNKNKPYISIYEEYIYP